MKRAWRAALLSGVIFPGLGQLWLKRYLVGVLLMVAVSASLGVVVVKAAHQALEILQRMENAGSVDMVAVADLATRASVTPDDFRTTAALVLLCVSWLSGVVHAFLAGRKLDMAARSRTESAAKGILDKERGGARP